MSSSVPRHSQPNPITRISDDVLSAIAGGRRYVCTYPVGIGSCGHSTAWCTGHCNAPRCEQHVIHGRCATCNGTVLLFADVMEQARTEPRYEAELR